MGQYRQGSLASLVALWTDFPGGVPVNVTTPQIQISELGGPVVLPATGVGITNPAVGYYAYNYAVPALATLGLYEATWTGLDVNLDPVVSRSTFEVIAAAADGSDGCENVPFFSKHWWYADGTIAANVRVAVYNEDQNVLANIFTDPALTLPAPNPGTTNPAGLFTFYAAEGTYWVVAGSVNWADSVCVTIDDGL